MFVKSISATLFCLGLGLLTQGLYMPAKALLAQHLIAQAWEETQKTGERKTPWSWMDAYPIAQLTLPDQKPHIVLNTDSGQALAFGPALVTEESLDTSKMIAIAAHKNTQFGKLKDIKKGEVISITLPSGDVQSYQMQDAQIIDTRHETLFDRGRATLALITCYPFDAVSFNGPLRYVVFARRIGRPQPDTLL